MSALADTLINRRLAFSGPPARVNLRRLRRAGAESQISRLAVTRGTVAPHAVEKERQLIQQAIDGDAIALEQIVATYSARLYRSAYAVLRNKEDAEDALQDSWCRAYTKLHSFEGRSSLSTWLTRIVVNSALMIRRKRNIHPESSLDEILDLRPEQLQQKIVDPRPNPEKICAATELNGLTEQQVRQLPPGARAAYQLFDSDGTSPAEARRMLGLGKSAFKSRISRARRMIASGLQQSLLPRAGRASVAAAI
jgi:RNA polymerase sigma-70 factor, ECF subfamily